jgi:hypothetical protein
MMDLKCEYAVVDVVSVLGTEQNVSNHITKWNVDANGVRQRYQGRNKQQKDLDLYDMKMVKMQSAYPTKRLNLLGKHMNIYLLTSTHHGTYIHYYFFGSTYRIGAGFF